jgi:hypothetical protein
MAHCPMVRTTIEGRVAPAPPRVYWYLLESKPGCHSSLQKRLRYRILNTNSELVCDCNSTVVVADRGVVVIQ